MSISKQAWLSTRILLTTSSPLVTASRGAAGRWREGNGLPPRFAAGPLRDLPEYSFVDGKGPGPVSRKVAARHERHKLWTKQVIQVLEEARIARQLVPDEDSHEKKQINEV